MTPEEQRIALAEWAGWKELRDGRYKKDGVVERFPPDYLNDLNAVHEMEIKLGSSQCAAYRDILEQNNDSYSNMNGSCVDWSLVHATAAQRCEALLKTLNLWKGCEA